MTKSVTIQLKGWKQILVGLIALIGLILGYSTFIQRGLEAELPKLIASRLKMDLGSEAARANLPMNDRDAVPTRAQAEKFVEQYTIGQEAKIVSLEKRGRGSSVVVRVKYSVPGQDAEQVRYYRLKHNWVTGWSVRNPVTEAAWHTRWL